MEYTLVLQKLCLTENRRLLFIMGMVAIFLVMLQTLTVPFGNPLSGDKFTLHGKITLSAEDTSPKAAIVSDNRILNTTDFVSPSVVLEMVEKTEGSDTLEEETENNGEKIGNKRDLNDEIILEEENVGSDDVSELDIDENPDDEFSAEQVVHLDYSLRKENIEFSDGGGFSQEKEDREPESVKNQTIEILPKTDNHVLLQTGAATSENSTSSIEPIVKNMKKGFKLPPESVMTISEMNRLLLQKRASKPTMKPKWSSVRDKELVSAKTQILNAPIVRNNRELYAPLFRNVSMFTRSYELMEQILKVYVYKEGEQPIFRRPILKGIYASEGWFMKLMMGNKKFIVKDPRKAHMFYMPFSTRMLQYTIYVPNSHNHDNLALYLKKYTNLIATKYSFWNRTGGADHFFVACHDWAPQETRHHMDLCIKSLCNADVLVGFEIGKDVSLPETYVRSERNPLRDVGGKPPSERSILAFFAGNMHGYLRPILLKHWENKDPDMKILGPMPPSVASKRNYIQHMKNSKYCICAKGFEVNSPRVVEAIFYECVPVIISDNFVPPFFDVLNWEAFAVFVPEKDIPKLKEILLSIPQEKYLELQLGVKKVQKHFLWHRKPMKYDLFYMTLHSIWYNRLFQIELRK